MSDFTFWSSVAFLKVSSSATFLTDGNDDRYSMLVSLFLESALILSMSTPTLPKTSSCVSFGASKLTPASTACKKPTSFFCFGVRSSKGSFMNV